MRRNRIFLLMEEARCSAARAVRGCAQPSLTRAALQVRRLRIQERVKTGESYLEEDITKQEFKSALPLLPPLVRCHARPSRRLARLAC